MEGILSILGIVIVCVFIPILLYYFIISKVNMDGTSKPILNNLIIHRSLKISLGIIVIIVIIVMRLIMFFLK